MDIAPINSWSRLFCELVIHSYAMIENNISSWECFNYLIDNILKITDSSYGMICKIDHNDIPILIPLGITNISWTNEMSKNWGPDMLSFKLDHDSLLYEPIKTKKIIISNDPKSHYASSGMLPKKHQSLDTYMGAPILHNGVPIGYIGIANRKSGYDVEMEEHINYLCSLLVSMIQIFKSIDNINLNANDGIVKKYTSMFIPTQDIINLMLNGIALVDKFYKIVVHNSQFSSIVNNQDADLKGSKILSYFPHFHTFLLENGKSITKEILYTKNNKQNILKISVTSIQIHQINYYIFEIIDKTEQADINLEKLREREYYLGILNHDIRNPLQSLIMSSSIIKEITKDEINSKINKHGEIILNSSKMIKKIIDNMQDLINLENDNYTISLDQINITDMIKSTIECYDGIIKHKDIRIQVDNIVDEITSDSNKITKIFTNLFIISLNKTFKSNILIKIRCNDNNLYITIKDNGDGFSYNELESLKIADKEKSIHNTDGYNIFGSILTNMSITIKLVKLLAGNLTINSIKGKGTTFELILPISNKNEAYVIPEHLNGNILVIDDNIDNNLLICDAIENINNTYGFSLNIMSASDGYDAVEKVKNYSFDLIFMDINMVGLNGIDTTKIIKQELNFKGYIIALTGNIFLNNDKFSEYENYSIFDDILNKPIEKKDIMHVLIYYLDNKSNSK